MRLCYDFILNTATHAEHTLSTTGDLAGFDARANYEAAARDYVIAASRYWPIASTRLVERMALRPGDRVLDVACGPGTSALLAARAVGPSGHVVAVDYGRQMLDIAEKQARSQGLTNIEFRLADMSQLDDPVASYDAVICVLGIFFVEEMADVTASLWQLVRPGGQLALTTMGPAVFEPLYSIWKEAYQAVRPQRTVRQPWERANRRQIVERLLMDAGVTGAASNVAITQESNRVPLPGPESAYGDDCWTVVMGTSLRSYMQELTLPEVAQVRERIFARVQSEPVTALQTDVILTVATKAP